ncbi:MAG: hypothetical protein AAB351_01940 [Patescibacteria group bacterium]
MRKKAKTRIKINNPLQASGRRLFDDEKGAASIVFEIESKQQILKQRKEIEQELVDMLKETESDFSLQDVQDVIFHEEDNDDMMKIIAMFDHVRDASELNNVLELVTDAWNYFPHKVLGGISPAEKLLEYKST